MCQVIQDALSVKLQSLQVGLQLRTPDNAVGAQFSIAQVGPTTITINLASGNTLSIISGAFTAAMHYLIRNGHDLANAIDIRSNNNPNLCGPLCHITRIKNNNVRCINYILPILQHFGYVGISGKKLNSCWYI